MELIYKIKFCFNTLATNNAKSGAGNQLLGKQVRHRRLLTIIILFI